MYKQTAPAGCLQTFELPLAKRVNERYSVVSNLSDLCYGCLRFHQSPVALTFELVKRKSFLLVARKKLLQIYLQRPLISAVQGETALEGIPERQVPSVVNLANQTAPTPNLLSEGAGPSLDNLGSRPPPAVCPSGLQSLQTPNESQHPPSSFFAVYFLLSDAQPATSPASPTQFPGNDHALPRCVALHSPTVGLRDTSIRLP